MPDPMPEIVVRPEPASWQLMEYVRDRIKLIVREDGYYTDLGGGSIVIDDGQADTSDGAPDTVIVTTNITTGSATGRQCNSDITVVIEAALPREDDTNPRLLSHRVSADLRRVLMVRERELPQFIRNLAITSCELVDVVDDQGSGSIVVQATARAGLTETVPPAT